GITGLVRRSAPAERECGDPSPGTYQPALGRVFLDQPAIVLGIGRRGHSGLELGQERLAPNSLEDTHPLELRRQGEEVDWLGFLEKVQCGTVDLSVLIHVEVV